MLYVYGEAKQYKSVYLRFKKCDSEVCFHRPLLFLNAVQNKIVTIHNHCKKRKKEKFLQIS